VGSPVLAYPAGKSVLVGSPCVAATALSAIDSGFSTTVLWNATRPVRTDDDTGARVLAELEHHGVRVVGTERPVRPGVWFSGLAAAMMMR